MTFHRNRIPQWIVLCFFLAAVVFSILGRLVSSAFGATMFLPPLRAAVPFTVIKDGVASICVPGGTVYRDGVMTVPTTCGVDTVFHNGFGGAQ